MKRKMPPINKENIIKKLETIYWHAISTNRWHTALQAAALQGKNLGMFVKRTLPEITSIGEMDEDELREFVERLERYDPELKKLELPPPTEQEIRGLDDYNSYSGMPHPPPPDNPS